MITQIPPQTLRALFAAAKEFYLAKPWETLTDMDIFGVVNPANQQKCYASIMGQGGTFFALALYPGKSGYQSLLLLQEETEDGPATDPEEAMYQQNCIMVSFETPDEIDPEDQALIDGMQIDVSGLDRLPAFRSYRPGQMPWAIDETEAKLLAEVLPLGKRVAHEVIAAYESADHFLKPDEDHIGQLRFFEQTEEENWEAVWKEPDTTMSFSPMQVTVGAEVLAEANALPREDEIWLVEQFYLREPVMDDSLDRPYFPKAFVLLDIKTQVLRGLDAVHPEQIAAEAAQCLVGMFKAHSLVPAQLVVSSKANFSLLRPLTKALGIELHLDEDFDVIGDIKEALYEQMEG